MSTFSVDPTTLSTLQGTISGLYTELSQMHNIAPSYDGLIGGSSLEGEVGHFLSAWHSGVALIEGDMEKVVQRLGEAAGSYAQSEGCIAAASAG
jgi:hypothetical protein